MKTGEMAYVKRLFRTAAITLLALVLFAAPAYAHADPTDITGITWRDTYGIFNTTFYGSGTYHCGHGHDWMEIRSTLQQEGPYLSGNFHDVSPTRIKHVDPPTGVAACPISRQVSQTCPTAAIGNDARYRVKIRVLTSGGGDTTVYRGQHTWRIDCLQ